MIRSFQHKGLEKFFNTGSRAGIDPAFASKLELQLALLNRATKPKSMGVPGWDLHPLKGDLKGHWSVKVNGNWGLTFRFLSEDAEVVDLQEYH
jgi:proteic killer suppression protein